MEGSNRVMQRTAERRSSSPCQSPSTPMPIGVMAPMPVITTRRGERSDIVYHTVLSEFPPLPLPPTNPLPFLPPYRLTALPPYRLTASLNVPPNPCQSARRD